MPSSDYREPSTSNNVASSSKPRKEISTVVIACRQWCVPPSLCSFIKPYNGILTDFGLRHPACLSVAVVEKSVATLRDPYVPIAPDDPTYANGSAPPPAKRKRTTGDRSSDPRETAPSTVKENMSNEKRSPPSSRPHDLHTQGQAPDLASSPTELRIITDGLSAMKHEQSPTSRRHHPFGYDQASYIKSSYPRQIDVNILRSPDTAHDKFPISLSPTVESEQRSWWDNFTRTYSLKEIENQFTYLYDSFNSLT
ncbi:hypothetical protein BDZ94DRAFT_1327694 [Collybia nuda]|uniref:Uncharacterized protein n=1 Tax=Collybia nuda TaxID=64659 RepID=A0A9P5XPH4_9AGAR|nr:hypothetical protein BDZ94DRAFT_1327694 [Collybia nuda]